MTQEEKAKAYDEDFEIAKKNYFTAQDLCEGSQIGIECFKNTLESIFSELKSEDERIKKEIIEYIKTGTYHKKWIEWLEKQGEPNPYSGVSFKYNGHIWGMCARDNGVEILVDGEIKERVFLGNKPQGKSALEAIREEKVDNANKIEPKDYSCIDPHFGKPIDKVEPKFKVGDIVQYITDSTDRRKIEEIDTLCNMYHTDSSPIMFEIENDWKVVLNSENVEQNLSYKVESKFKVGDWITNGDYTWKIISVDKFDYTLQNQWGEYIEDTINYVNKAFHLWTIKDAKNGDVLATEDKNFTTPFVAIYKSIGDTVYDNITFNSHCFIGFDGNFYGGEEGHTIEDIHPATKEQQKLLSKRMKEAGYKWDSEKKELIKEEVK